MAVNYPARKFGIKRGDSFEVIQEKSKGKCVAIHLPGKSISTVLSLKQTSICSLGDLANLFDLHLLCKSHVLIQVSIISHSPHKS